MAPQKTPRMDFELHMLVASRCSSNMANYIHSVLLHNTYSTSSSVFSIAVIWQQVLQQLHVLLSTVGGSCTPGHKILSYA